MELIKNPDYYITFKQSEFKIPIEVLKKNFKNLQRQIDKHTTQVRKLVKSLKKLDVSARRECVQKIIGVQKSFNDKIKPRIAQHNQQIDRLVVRIARIDEIKALHKKYLGKNGDAMPAEVIDFYKFENQIMMVNYLLDQEHPMEKVQQLAADLGVSEYIDFEIYQQLHKIKHEILVKKNLKLLKLWCVENEKNLTYVKLHYPKLVTKDILFQSNLQEFIELIKRNQFEEAIYFSRENIKDLDDEKMNELFNAASLIRSAFYQKYHSKPQFNRDDPLEFYTYYTNEEDERNFQENCQNLHLLKESKWNELYALFELNFKLIYGLNMQPTFISTLNIGISSIKTKSCTPSTLQLAKSNVIPPRCPVCSTDFGTLSLNHPISFQSKSNLFDDPVMLDGNVYSFKRLLFYNRDLLDGEIINKNGHLTLERFESNLDPAIDPSNQTKITDPISGAEYPIGSLMKIYPT